MSSLDAVKAALETRLNAMSPVLPTCWENTLFSPPSSAYQLVNILPAPPDNPALGDGMYRERGLMQVTLSYPMNEGAGNALARAVAIRDWFARGSSFTSGAVTARIPSTPAIAQGYQDEGRYLVPVSVEYFADIFPS